MKRHLAFAFVALASVRSAATANESPQRGAPPSNSLSRVLGVFSVSDANRDGKVSAEEARAIPVTPEEHKKQDLDGDGSWSRDEFTLYYRARLVAGGQSVGSDLDAEVARIEALKRVRVVEEARRGGGESPPGHGEVEPVHVRLERALGELERNAAEHKATPQDFRRLRNLVILSGRSVPPPKGEPLPSTTGAKMLQTLDRLEKRVASGQSGQEEFDSLRRLAAPFARPDPAATPPAKAVPPPKATAPSTRTGPVQGPADARQRANDPRGSTRPKPPTPKPVDRPAPPPGTPKEADRRTDP